MAGAVIDASVAVKWFLQEEGSAEARSLLVSGTTLSAPSALFLEVTHAIWGAVKRGRTAPEALGEVAKALPRIFPEPVPDLLIFARAAELMLTHAHPIYDCLYLGLASRPGMTLITADERQFAVARRARIDARLL